MKHAKLIKKFLIPLIFLEIAIFVFFYFGYLDVKSKNQDASVLKGDLASQVQRQQYMSSMQAMIKSTDSDITKVNNSIVQNDQDVNFIESLEKIARENNLQVVISSLVIKDSKDLSASGLSILSLKANLKGGWAGMYSFLVELESQPFKIKIDKFAMASSEDKQWQGVFEIEVLKYK